MPVVTEFASQRRHRVSLLKGQLYETLVKPDSGSYLAKTGSLIRGSSLRGKDNREKFANIIKTFPLDPVGKKQRVWTKALFQDTLKALVSDYNLELPRLPGFDFQTWVTKQAKLLQNLSRKAQRNSFYIPRSRSMDVDGAPTLDYNPEDFWVGSVACFVRGKKNDRIYIHIYITHIIYIYLYIQLFISFMSIYMRCFLTCIALHKYFSLIDVHAVCLPCAPAKNHLGEVNINNSKCGSPI